MRIDFTNTLHRALFLGFAVVCSGSLIFLSGKACLAAHWNATSDPALWLNAAKLEPGRAEYWGRLGRSRQWDLTGGDTRDAAHYLEKATQVNPRSADLWMELADAYQAAGDANDAEEAYAKAQKNYPISAEVARRYGSFLLYEERYREAYEQFHRALEADPLFTTTAISECWRSRADITPILNNVLPAKPGVYVDAMDFFLSQNLTEPAFETWNRCQELKLPIKIADAVPLVDALIAHDRTAEAQQVWNEGLRAEDRGQARGKDESIIFNGGFEQDIINGGFDWRELAIDGAVFTVDEFAAHSGSRSLRVRFDGTANLDFQNLLQFVAVEPGTRYRFSAYLQSERISTDQGVHFEILDPKHPSELRAVTPDVVGTTPWTMAQIDITAGPDTHLVRIALRRMPSWRFDNKLSGTIWVDDVSLTPISESTKDNSR